jgi:hypothetical protein
MVWGGMCIGVAIIGFIRGSIAIASFKDLVFGCELEYA